MPPPAARSRPGAAPVARTPAAGRGRLVTTTRSPKRTDPAAGVGAGQHPKQGGLAGAAGAEDGGEGPGRHVEVEVVEDRRRAVADGHSAHGYRGHALSSGLRLIDPVRLIDPTGSGPIATDRLSNQAGIAASATRAIAYGAADP